MLLLAVLMNNTFRRMALTIRGAKAADFRKGEMSREEITDLMAGGEAMAELEAEIEGYMTAHEGHPPAGRLKARQRRYPT